MRAHQSVLMMSLCVLAACGGGEKTGADTTSKATTASPDTAAVVATGAAQAITGKTWDVKMLGDAGGYRFDPPSLTIKRGDGVCQRRLKTEHDQRVKMEHEMGG
jgi:plastocyanin